VLEVTIPSYEGLMTILKDHISIVTFLRPGLIEIRGQNETEKFFIEEGTVEFSNNQLLILSSTTENIKNFDSSKISEMIKITETSISENNSGDKKKYILSHKLDTLKELN
jgi:F-type H+-transporting ATPase subunit epsilon/F-type H+-transporting ATPase subunit delta